MQWPSRGCFELAPSSGPQEPQAGVTALVPSLGRAALLRPGLNWSEEAVRAVCTLSYHSQAAHSLLASGTNVQRLF